MNTHETAAARAGKAAGRGVPIRIKICGITREADLDAAVAAGADAVGFVLYEKSPRHVTPLQAAALAQRLPPLVRPVLLFVNAAADEVRAVARRIPGATLQFHGDEPAATCAQVAAACGCPYWRAARMPVDGRMRFDLLEFVANHRDAQGILLDAHTEGYGGGGKPFDWTLLPGQIPAHLILSGGLNAENVADGIAALRGRGKSLTVDVSSGVEARDAAGQPLRGTKDAEKIRRFVAAVRAADPAWTSA